MAPNQRPGHADLLGPRPGAGHPGQLLGALLRRRRRAQAEPDRRLVGAGDHDQRLRRAGQGLGRGELQGRAAGPGPRRRLERQGEHHRRPRGQRLLGGHPPLHRRRGQGQHRLPGRTPYHGQRQLHLVRRRPQPAGRGAEVRARRQGPLLLQQEPQGRRLLLLPPGGQLLPAHRGCPRRPGRRDHRPDARRPGSLLEKRRGDLHGLRAHVPQQQVSVEFVRRHLRRRAPGRLRRPGQEAALPQGVGGQRALGHAHHARPHDPRLRRHFAVRRGARLRDPVGLGRLHPGRPQAGLQGDVRPGGQPHLGPAPALPGGQRQRQLRAPRLVRLQPRQHVASLRVRVRLLHPALAQLQQPPGAADVPQHDRVLDEPRRRCLPLRHRLVRAALILARRPTPRGGATARGRDPGRDHPTLSGLLRRAVRPGLPLLPLLELQGHLRQDGRAGRLQQGDDLGRDLHPKRLRQARA